MPKEPNTGIRQVAAGARRNTGTSKEIRMGRHGVFCATFDMANYDQDIVMVEMTLRFV